jgi:hypothetical protein
MQLARRISLLVAVTLLTSIATANAECSWVLWSYGLNGGLIPTLSNSPVIPAKSALPRSASNATSMTSKGYSVSGNFPGSSEIVGRQGATTFKYYCLPDTVDPRGPRGK